MGAPKKGQDNFPPLKSVDYFPYLSKTFPRAFTQIYWQVKLTRSESYLACPVVMVAGPLVIAIATLSPALTVADAGDCAPHELPPDAIVQLAKVEPLSITETTVAPPVTPLLPSDPTSEALKLARLQLAGISE